MSDQEGNVFEKKIGVRCIKVKFLISKKKKKK